MRPRPTLLFWTDVANTLLVAAILTTGSILHWVLPAGSGRHAANSLLSLHRHDWATLHFYIALTLVTGILLHLALHFGWIKTNTARRLHLDHPKPLTPHGSAFDIPPFQ